MKNRKYKLLPYETIVKAAAGEPDAVNTVIQTYTGYIKYLSYFQGSINDDIQDYLKVILSILVDTFFSRISLSMPPIPKSHDTVCVLSWEEVRHWQSRSSGYSSS